MKNAKYEEMINQNQLWMELYMTDEGYKFEKGYLYCLGQAVEMDAIPSQDIDLPMDLQDCVLVGTSDEVLMWEMAGSSCRYYLDGPSIEFFKKPSEEEDEVNYPVPMVIHNICKRPLTICFEGIDETWTIQPGENKRIIPWRTDGADSKE